MNGGEASNSDTGAMKSESDAVINKGGATPARLRAYSDAVVNDDAFTLEGRNEGKRRKGILCVFEEDEECRERRVRSEPLFPIRWICNTLLEIDNINYLSFTMHSKLEFEL